MKKIKNFCSILIVICLILFCINRLNFLLRPLDTDGAYYQIESFHSLPENSVEVITYGSSHALYGINPMEMYKKYGIGSYNYSYHWQRINTSKLFLEDSFLTQNPKVILMESYMAGNVLRDLDEPLELYYCNYIHDENAKKEYRKKCMGNNASLETKLAYAMPITLFHDNWNMLSEGSFTKLVPTSTMVHTMGHSSITHITPVDIPDYATLEQHELDSDSMNELNDILNICKQHNTEIIFFTLPYVGDYSFKTELEKFAQENDCVYLDFFELFDEVGFDGSTDFWDGSHLNENGANKVSEYLGQYLSEHYNLTDMRTIEDNIWEQQLP